MQKPKEYVKEKERLRDLESYTILDTLPESDYDDLTAIAAELCGTKISLITLVDDTRQWFKSHHGIDVSETPKEWTNKSRIKTNKRNKIYFHNRKMIIYNIGNCLSLLNLYLFFKPQF